MNIPFKNGFTLIELLVALSVAGILLGVGIPSFSQAMQNRRNSANYNSVAQALYIGRSEAVKGSNNISVCPRAVGETNSCGTDWSKGMLVFVDNNPIATDPNPALGTEDEVLHSQGELKTGTTVKAWTAFDRTGTNRYESNVLTYRPDGTNSWANGFFSVCDDKRGPTHAKALNVVVTGDIRRGRPASATSKIPIDVYGDGLDSTCPAANP